MSWRRSTLSRRRLAVVACAGVIAAGLVPVALARTAPPAQDDRVAADDTPDQAPATATPAASPTPVTTAAPTAAPEPSKAAGKKVRSVKMTDKELANARQVAADFAAAYASYRYDESPADAAARLAPWSTEELAQQLAANTGGTAARAELAERQQVAEAQVETVAVQRVNGRDVDLLVVVQQKLTWDGGKDTRWPSYLTRVSRGADGWRVAALQP